MFKLAVITEEISQDPAVAAAMMREFGGQGLEICSASEKGPHELDDSVIARLKQIAEAHWLHIRDIAPPVFKWHLGVGEDERKHLAMLHRCIAFVHALDTSLIRIFTFWQQPDPPPWELLRLAAQEGIILGIENAGTTMG